MPPPRTMRIPWITSSGTAPGKSLANHATSWPRSTSAARYASVTRSAPPALGLCGSRQFNIRKRMGFQGSAWSYLGHAELAHALDFVPAVQTPAEEAQHPQVAPAAELPDPPALGQDVPSQPPAIRHRIPIGAAHKSPPPDQRQSRDTFEDEQAELQWDQQKKQ